MCRSTNGDAMMRPLIIKNAKNMNPDTGLETSEPQFDEIPSDMDARSLLHQLQVHQLELEMQGEELRLARELADAATTHYAELYDFAPIAYFTLTRDGAIGQTNLAGAAILGKERSKLKGQRFISFVDTKDRRAFSVFLETIFSDGNREVMELSMSNFRGEQRYLHLEGVGDVTGLNCRMAATDITQRHEAEEALLKASALQNAIFNSANFASIATDENGVIQIFNVGAERMLGYTAFEVMNKVTPAGISNQKEVIARAESLSLEFGTPIAPGFEALAFKASRGIEDIYELTYIRRDGSPLPAAVSVTALFDAHESIIGYLLIVTDNTSRKQIEQQRKEFENSLKEKNIELELAKAVAEKANLAKSEFLSSMSHELRTPLNAVLGFAQLMASDIPPPSARQMLSIEQILQAGWYLLRLINEILDLAIIEAGKVTISQEAMSLSQVLKDSWAMVAPQADKCGITMTFPCLDVPLWIHGDQIRIKQVMINLLSNAIKYNRNGGTVSMECAMSLDNQVRISIKDSGIGLAPEQLAQLFQPFNRLGQENGSKEGTGIGLVVTKQLVELMGGTIGVESSVGIGSLFWVEFSAADAPEPEADGPDQYGQHEATKHIPASRHTLLYVEDNPANLLLVEQLVARRMDLTLLTATEGNQGFQLARSHQPDVILLDINLPGISGLDVLKLLHEDPQTAHIPVMALSANAMPRDLEKGLEAGFLRYLTKPIKAMEFMDALDAAFHIAAKNDFPPRLEPAPQIARQQ